MSSSFHYSQQGRLFCESVDLQKLCDSIADDKNIDTPLYVYSKNILLENIFKYKDAFKDRQNIIGYSVKANSNAEILRIFQKNDLSAVVVSGNELQLCLDLGFSGEKIFYNGNGKQDWELRLALLNGVIMNVDSVFNAISLVEIAEEMQIKTEILIRMNIDIDTKVHPYLKTVSKNCKFGIVLEDIDDLLKVILPCKWIKIIGFHCHLGSTINDMSVYKKVFQALKEYSNNYKHHLKDVKIINIGGGLGINYHKENPENISTAYCLAKALPKDSDFVVMVEPGRSLVGDAGTLLTKVLGVKETSSKRFVVVDGSMTELVRPALYEAYHQIIAVQKPSKGDEIDNVDFVGPVCESGDFLGKNRSLIRPQKGDIFAIMDAGAYGMAMASNYNLRAKPAEILIDNTKAWLIKKRESFSDVMGLTVNQEITFN